MAMPPCIAHRLSKNVVFRQSASRERKSRNPVAKRQQVTIMNDKLHEELSAFMDDETPAARRLAERLSRDPELQARWSRYHLIRDAMTEHLTYAEFDIASRVSAVLENEPTVLAPRRRWHLPLRARRVARQMAGLAIAATVSAVTVMTVQQQRGTDAPAPVVAQVAGDDRLAMRSPPARVVQFVPENRQLNPAVRSKLSNYLVNHNEYSVTSNMQGVLPYMRIVSGNLSATALPPRPAARLENAIVDGK